MWVGSRQRPGVRIAARPPLYVSATFAYRRAVPFTGWSSEVTPRDIARTLDISEKTLRAWLRKNPQVIHAHNERWIVTPEDADRVVAVYRESKR